MLRFNGTKLSSKENETVEFQPWTVTSGGEACEIINDGKEVYNIEPSWLADRLDKAPDSGPFDIYPVRAIARQNHKIIAGGGPVTCNGEYWPMATLSVFE